MPLPPQRFLLVDQTVELLRNGIAAGRWRTTLPSESKLCGELHISRNTLRGAIAQLAREDWLTLGGKGRRHVIRRSEKEHNVVTGRIVRLLSPYSLPVFGALNNSVMEKLGAQLSARGYRLEYERRPTLFSIRSEQQLTQLTNLPDTAAWVLMYAPEAVQRWFAASGLPCLVIGSVYPDINLSSVSPDTVATAEHAAGLFYGRGHREMVYFIETRTSYSDRLASETFARSAKLVGARAHIVPYEPGVRNLRQAIVTVLAMRPRPTAIYSSSPESCLTVLGLLREANLRFPQDVSLVSGAEEWFLPYAVPTIAHYHFNGARLGQLAAKLLFEQMAHGPDRQRTLRVLAKFVPGETFGAVVSSR